MIYKFATTAFLLMTIGATFPKASFSSEFGDPPTQRGNGRFLVCKDGRILDLRPKRYESYDSFVGDWLTDVMYTNWSRGVVTNWAKRKIGRKNIESVLMIGKTPSQYTSAELESIVDKLLVNNFTSKGAYSSYIIDAWDGTVPGISRYSSITWDKISSYGGGRAKIHFENDSGKKITILPDVNGLQGRYLWDNTDQMFKIFSTTSNRISCPPGKKYILARFVEILKMYPTNEYGERTEELPLLIMTTNVKMKANDKPALENKPVF